MPDSVTIALWGPPSAGKTALLAQLFLRHTEKESEWQIFPTSESQAFLEIVRKRLNANFFPDPTDVPKNLRYRFRNVSSGREALLFVEDRPGRESAAPDEESKARLNGADGLVLLFDPGRNARELEDEIMWTLNELNVAADREGQDPRPIAVCLSKADQKIVTPEDLALAREEPAKFVMEKISPEILNWVTKLCSNVELFPVSSLGVRLRYGAIQPMVFFDDDGIERIMSDSAPINLIAPFAWIFSKLEGRSRT